LFSTSVDLSNSYFPLYFFCEISINGRFYYHSSFCLLTDATSAAGGFQNQRRKAVGIDSQEYLIKASYTTQKIVGEIKEYLKERYTNFNTDYMRIKNGWATQSHFVRINS